MTDTPVLKLVNVSKIIGGKRLVDKLSLTLNKGEIYGFLGPNGAGKTTTIRMIVGLFSMSEGEIFVNGLNIQTHRSEALQAIGAIVENPSFYNYMSGYDNLVHHARMSLTDVTEERIKEVISFVKLDDAIHDKVKTYSLGMRQRLGIAQSLLHRPSLLILDEPTNGLDPAGIRELRDHLRNLAKKENIAILVSSHLLQEIESMCDRAIIIQKGQFVQELTIRSTEQQEEMAKTVLLDVSTPEIAATLLTNVEARHTDGKLAIVATRAQIAECVKVLVANDISVYGIATQQVSLEDQFIQLTSNERGR